MAYSTPPHGKTDRIADERTAFLVTLHQHALGQGRLVGRAHTPCAKLSSGESGNYLDCVVLDCPTSASTELLNQITKSLHVEGTA